MDSKKVIVCDLDGTLAPSKSSLSADMAEVIFHILSRHLMAIVSGGAFEQFEKQVLSQLKFSPYLLQNLYLFPAMGSTCFKYETKSGHWVQLYNELLSKKERDKIKKAIDEGVKKIGLDLSGPYGEIVEDRGSQITFSGRGQKAPIEVKEVWDKDQSKRKALIKILEVTIPEFDCRLGGISSIDITRKGIDKAYAIGKIKELLKVSDEEIIFVGDALYEGGNDEPVKGTGVDFIQEEGPNQTLELLSRYM